MSEENKFEEEVINNQKHISSQVETVGQKAIKVAATLDEIKGSVEELSNTSGSSSSSEESSQLHYWVALVLSMVMAALITAFVMNSMLNKQSTIAEVVEATPAKLNSAVKDALKGETLSKSINGNINSKLEALQQEILKFENARKALEEAKKNIDEGGLPKFCPGFNRKGERESFRLMQMFAFAKGEKDLSMGKAEQICMINKEGCMECRILGRNTPCDYSSTGGCEEVANEQRNIGYSEGEDDVCKDFDEADPNWDSSQCNTRD